jgi:competence protein ComEC
MDEMKRKLAQLDEDRGGRPLWDRLPACAPLFVPAAGLMTGIVLQSFVHGGLPVALWTWLTVLAVCAVGSCAAAVRHRSRAVTVLAVGAGFCFVCLGAIRLIAFQTPGPTDIRRAVDSERCLATIRGAIVTEPRADPCDWYFARHVFTDPATVFYLKIEQARTADGWRPVTGTVRMQVAEPMPHLGLGDAIEAYCWLYRLPEPTNPGQFDVAAYLRRRHVHFGASAPCREAVTVLRHRRPGLLAEARRRLRYAAAQALFGHGAALDPVEGLLQALLLGQRHEIDPRTYEAFRRTGLLHFVSLSGLHLGILIGAIWWICGRAGLLKPARAVVCAIATAVFLLVVPPRAPTVRAAIIVWVFCLSVLVRRRGNVLNSLSLAAIILLLVRPTQLFEAGWQLSFAAVAGILALTRRIENTLHECGRRLHTTERPAGAGRAFGEAVTRLLATGIAAWIGGAGVVLYHFHTVTPLAAFWTVLAFPLIALMLTVGYVKMVLYFLLPTLSAILGLLLSAITEALLWFVKLVAPLRINYLLIGHVAIWVVVLYYALVLLVTLARTRHVRLKRWLCVTAALALAGYLGALKWQRTHRDHLSLTCLDVGHGQAILARLPGSASILFDAGSLYRRDAGGRIVVPFLDHIGLDRLTAVTISHKDVDHINGIPEILDRRRVDHVYAGAPLVTDEMLDGPARTLLQYFREADRVVERMPRVIRSREAVVRRLWPRADVNLPEDLGDNDRSLVMAVEYAGVTVLLCSDIEQFAQKQIRELYPNLRADVVVAPHHGSKHTLDEGFLEALAPSVLVASQAERPDSPGQTPARLAGTRSLSTAKNGAVTICVDKGAMVTTAAHLRPDGD